MPLYKRNGNGCLYINGKKFYSFSTTRYFDYASRLEIVFSPDPDYVIKSIILDGDDITDELDKDNKYVIAHILENIQMEVTFVSKENITSSESIQNEQGKVYASASESWLSKVLLLARLCMFMI